MKSLFVGSLIGVFVLLGSSAFAQDLNFQEYRKFLMSGTQGANKKMAIQTTCTSTSGQSYHIGETGYDTCLAAIKSQQDAKQLSGSKSSTAPSAQTGASTTIHIGN